MSNPLLDFSTLPRFRDFRAGHVEPAVAELVGQGSRTIERLAALDVTPTWENFVEPLDDANEKLARAWAQVSHLNAVMNSPELREAYNKTLPVVTQFFAEQGRYLMCQTHNAYFEPASGECIAGPPNTCGKYLYRVPLEIEDGVIYARPPQEEFED